MADFLKQNNRDLSVLPLRGHCNGFSMLAQYYFAQDKEDEFFTVMELFASWDGKPESLVSEAAVAAVKDLSGNYANLHELFDQWINDVVLFQNKFVGGGQKNRLEQFNLVGKGDISLEYLLPPRKHNKMTEEQLAEMLRVWSRSPRTILEFGGGKHATSAHVLENGSIAYYDPNFSFKALVFKSPEELAKVIKATKFRVHKLPTDPMEMNLIAYRYHKREASRPISTQ